MKRPCILAVILAFVCSACGAAPIPNYDYSKEPDPRQREYVLGVSDALDINVWKNNELSTRALIRPDGTITMPLIGDLHAAGKTPTELKREIEERLTKYIKLEGTEITIAVTNAASYRFTVSGEVSRPGIFTSAYYVTVAEAIALAGGFSRFAERERMTLMRRDPKSGKVRNIPINYKQIENGKRMDMNLVLMPGDAIYVP